MKRIIISSLMVITTFLATAQQTAVDEIFNRYSGKDGYTTVYISSFMFNLMHNLDLDDPEYQKFKEASSGIKSIRILSQDGEGSVSFGAGLISMLPREEYREMMVVKDKEEEVLFLAREQGGQISEMLLIVSGGNDDVLIAIQGSIDLESLASIASGLDVPGLENLKGLKEKP